MDHPLITDADDLSIDDLQKRLADLTNKFFIAQQSGNAHMCNQIRLAIETYRAKLMERYNEDNKNNPDLDDKINVS